MNQDVKLTITRVDGISVLLEEFSDGVGFAVTFVIFLSTKEELKLEN